jgi:metal-dependent hydrolase (beta-lactamase superfamily II)
MSHWNAEQFYDENDHSETDFNALTKPVTYLNSWLPVVLRTIIRDDLTRYGFSVIVHTADGSVLLDASQHAALLRIQERKNAETMGTR